MTYCRTSCRHPDNISHPGAQAATITLSISNPDIRTYTPLLYPPIIFQLKVHVFVKLLNSVIIIKTRGSLPSCIGDLS